MKNVVEIPERLIERVYGSKYAMGSAFSTCRVRDLTWCEPDLIDKNKASRPL